MTHTDADEGCQGHCVEEVFAGCHGLVAGDRRRTRAGMTLEACAASAPTECNHECRVKDRPTVCARKRGVLVVKVTSSTLSLPLTKGILLAIAGTKPVHIREPSGGPQSCVKGGLE